MRKIINKLDEIKYKPLYQLMVCMMMVGMSLKSKSF
jgi:hypothetical protein